MNKLFINKVFAGVLILLFVVPAFPIKAKEATQKIKLTEHQKVVHVLNRLGFGPRAGDVERVKAMGIQKYIEQQLDPMSIDDLVAESKVSGIEIHKMTTAQLFAKYPNPAALLNMLEGGRANANGPQRNPEEMDEKERQERQQKIRELYQKYDLRPANQLPAQVISNRVLRAVYSERQLQEVMVDFWQNHFNVFSGKAAVRWYIPSYERDVLRKHALGSFRDLVVGTAQHPAMLFYLDNFESVAPVTQPVAQRLGPLQEALRSGDVTPQMRERIKRQQGLSDEELDRRIRQAQAAQRNLQQSQRGINENYARELMELHTVGVDSGYTQKDIVEVARAFTGWTIADSRGFRQLAAATIQGNEEQRFARLQRQAGFPDGIESGEFYFNERWHDKQPKKVLGQSINEGGIKDGLKVIDILVKHPATAKHIARKLAIRFVSDKPSDELVNRVAASFTRSSGDIKATLRGLFSDKEFFAPQNYRAKIKTPFELAISSIRTLGGETNVSPALIGLLNKLGEVPYGYQAPTGYPDTAEDWVNTGALLERLNFAIALSANQIPGTRVDLGRFKEKDQTKTLDKAITSILNNEVTQETKASLTKQLAMSLKAAESGIDRSDVLTGNPMGPPVGGIQGERPLRLLPQRGDPEVFKVVSLVLGTPEFQRQ
ncbi:MAG TPA: DUF1800 domain-containing protein [Pyrinomonadaceae bacterium]|nr:DUF1800 domain-containing protein [Pyrinomonadaceae bacterium]